MVTTWEATFINASTAQTSIAMWADPGGGAALIWLSAFLAPNTFTAFNWQFAYEFVWAYTGLLTPGKTIFPAQRLDMTADMTTARLQPDGQGSYELVPVQPAPPNPPGSFAMQFDNNLPPGTLSAGINLKIQSGMGQPGSAVAILPVSPGGTATWLPPTKYCAGYGALVQGQYAPPAIAAQDPVSVDFATGTTVILMLDQTNVLRQITNAHAAAVVKDMVIRPGLTRDGQM